MPGLAYLAGWCPSDCGTELAGELAGVVLEPHLEFNVVLGLGAWVEHQ